MIFSNIRGVHRRKPKKGSGLPPKNVKVRSVLCTLNDSSLVTRATFNKLSLRAEREQIAKVMAAPSVARPRKRKAEREAMHAGQRGSLHRVRGIYGTPCLFDALRGLQRFFAAFGGAS